MPNSKPSDAALENLRDAWSAFGKTIVASAAGLRDAHRKIAERSAEISVALERVRAVGTDAVTMITVARDAWQNQAVPVLRMVEINAATATKAAQVGECLIDAGWLPWFLAPTKELMEANDPVAFFDEWVVMEWPAIAKKLTDNVQQFRLGKSAAKTLRAAILLHEAGLYEQVPRVLFPEIEKSVAEHFHGKNIPHGETQLTDFRSHIEMLWGLATTGFALLAPGMAVARGQIQVLALHCYVGSSKMKPRPDLPNAEFFPNRNRVLHGRRSGEYDTAKASLNSLFLFDIMMLGLAFTVKFKGRDLDVEDASSTETDAG